MDYKEKESQTAPNIAAHISKQMIARLSTIPGDLLESLEFIKSSQNMYEWGDVIRRCAHHFRSMFVVIDAMDECRDYRTRHQLLTLLNSIGGKIMITSRHKPPKELKVDTIMVEATDSDVETYVRSTLEQTGIKPQIRDQIAAKIVGSAQKMYALVASYVDHLQVPARKVSA